jgi:hypothetical protein
MPLERHTLLEAGRTGGEWKIATGSGSTTISGTVGQ